MIYPLIELTLRHDGKAWLLFARNGQYYTVGPDLANINKAVEILIDSTVSDLVALKNGVIGKK